MEKFTITLTKEDLDVLGQLIDAGVRSQGLAAVKHAAYIVQLLEKAQPVEEEENGA